MNRFQAILLAADDSFYEGECCSLIVPTLQGQYGVLANHCNMVAAVIPGEMHYTLPGMSQQTVAVSSGIMKIESNEVIILVDTIERPEEIDANRALRASEAAREALMQKQSIQEHRMTQAYLARALSRLQVKGHYRKDK